MTILSDFELILFLVLKISNSEGKMEIETTCVTFVVSEIFNEQNRYLRKPETFHHPIVGYHEQDDSQP